MDCVNSSERYINPESQTQINVKINDDERLIVRRAMLEHLSTNDKFLFTNLGEDQKELSTQQKLDIADELLSRSYVLFLAKFGNYILQEHLCYFENASNEDRVIVNIYLKQLKKKFGHQKTNKMLKMDLDSVVANDSEKIEVSTEQNRLESSKMILRSQLLDHLSLSKDAHFRSQQVGEPDLSSQEKREIAEALLMRSSELFLARFGTHLLEQHLDYFDESESYEVNYHLKHLRQTHCKEVSQIGIKNRRFEALKKMVEEGSYFCESEMRSRNPLLYEQLVGRFLTPEERKERLNNTDSANTSFSNILLEHMDQMAIMKLKQEQEDAEDNAKEEEDSSDEEMETEEVESEDDQDLDKTLWGEGYTDDKTPGLKKNTGKYDNKKDHDKGNGTEETELSDAEKQLLMEEFRSNMFSNFLQGKDINFDYNQVDYNSDYDDLAVETLDAEEKYFDEESSQGASGTNISDEEDELDKYLSDLKSEPTPLELANRLLSMNTNNA